MTLQITATGRMLVFWGALLFLLGMLQGLAIPIFANSRMGLSAHLAAVQSGMALMIFGAIWSLCEFNARWERVAYVANVAGIYLVWIAISLSAALGASQALPMAGKGFGASPGVEMIVQAIVVVGATAGILGGFLIVGGLYKGLNASD